VAHPSPPSPEEARALLTGAPAVPRASRRDRTLVAAGIAGPNFALAALLLWGMGHTQDGLHNGLLVAFAVTLIGCSFLRTRARTTPYDSRRLGLVAAVLTVPAMVIGLVIAHLSWGPALAYQLLGFLVVVAPGVLVGRRVLRGEPG
jgi:hypothetical protein